MMTPPPTDRVSDRTSEVLEIEMALLLEALIRRWGIDLRGWAAAPLRARLGALMHERGLASLSALQGVLIRDAATIGALVGTLWRGPAVLSAPSGQAERESDKMVATLRREVVPVLRSWPFVRVWVAGCGAPSADADANAVARLLIDEGLEARARVHATDPDEAIIALARARHGDRGIIAWGRHIPGVDGVLNEFSLILFRHPFIWTGVEARRRVVELLRASQARFGFMVADRSARPWLDGWTVVDNELGLMRRVS